MKLKHISKLGLTAIPATIATIALTSCGGSTEESTDRSRGRSVVRETTAAAEHCS